MKTLGERLKDMRNRKGLSIKQLERETKIKAEFIAAIEKNDWEKLPEYPVLRGFIKNIAGSLGLNVEQTVALFRRDYPPKQLRVNPRPDIKKRFSWSPRITFVTALLVVALLVVGYLGYQYYQFTQPPYLNIVRPEQGQEVYESKLFVEGETDPEATVVINNQPTVVKDDGGFSAEINVSQDTKQIIVQATSRSEKQTTVVRKIVPMLEE